jgi:hypothetical protein
LHACPISTSRYLKIQIKHETPMRFHNYFSFILQRVEVYLEFWQTATKSGYGLKWRLCLLSIKGCNRLVRMKNVRFQVFTAASMKVTVFWDVVPWSGGDIYRRFRGAKFLPCPTDFHNSNQFLSRGLLIALMMEAACTSETSVNFYQNTRRNIPEDSHLQDEEW